MENKINKEILAEAEHRRDNYMYFGYDEKPDLETIIEHLLRK
jgi:hypothetical protein